MGFADASMARLNEGVLQAWGRPVLYRPQFNDAIEVVGVFDERHIRADATRPGEASVGPAVFLRLADLKLADGTQIDPADDVPLITVAGVEYRLREALPDGQGGVMLFLHRV